MYKKCNCIDLNNQRKIVFVDLKKAFDRADWKKLMWILKTLVWMGRRGGF